MGYLTHLFFSLFFSAVSVSLRIYLCVLKYTNKPVIVAPPNPSCSTSTSTLSTCDGFTCDASLMVENETLKKEVNELTRTLGKAYGGEDCLLMYLGSQRASLYYWYKLMDTE